MKTSANSNENSDEDADLALRQKIEELRITYGLRTEASTVITSVTGYRRKES
jgi:hypothetical protein